MRTPRTALKALLLVTEGALFGSKQVGRRSADSALCSYFHTMEACKCSAASYLFSRPAGVSACRPHSLARLSYCQSDPALQRRQFSMTLASNENAQQTDGLTLALKPEEIEELAAMEIQSRPDTRSSAAGEASTSGREHSASGLTSSRWEIPRSTKIPTCDFTTLAACAAELAQHWVPSKVDQIVQCDEFTLSLKLRNQEMMEGATKERIWMYLSWHQVLARICMGTVPERGSTAEAFSLAEQMHSVLRGLVLLEVSLPRKWERIVQLSFGPRLEETSHRLYLEVMGNYSNLILTDEEGRIECCARQISSRMSSRRTLQTGAVYALPPAQFAVPPSGSEPLSVWQMNLRGADSESQARGRKSLGLSEAMVSAYQGVSPSLADQTCSMAGVNPSIQLRYLTDKQWGSLHERWVAWIHAVQAATFEPTFSSSDGSLSVIGAFDEPAAEGVLQAVDTRYRMPQEEDSFAKLHQRVDGVVKKALKRLKAKRHALQSQLDQAQLADDTQKQADLITTNLYRYERGADSLEVQNWETGETERIPLNPAEPAKDQAEELYKKARKLRRTSGNVEPLLLEAEEDEQFLREIESQLQMLQPEDQGDLQALREIQDELVQRNFCKPPTDAALAARGAAKARKARRKSSLAGPNFREFTSPSGFQVLVGRNNVQNDELTHRVATESDLWFHARGVPGSHTVLRIPSGRSETESDIQFAADAAAFFSKARAEGKADVVYAFVKDLKKPRGARPGQVMVIRERVIVARPSSCPAA